MTIEELWLTEHTKIRRFLARGMPVSVALDLTDEAFARAVAKGHTRKEHIWQCALDLSAEWFRREAVRAELEPMADLLFGTAIPDIETAIVRADFDRAFRQLPREQAEAFALTELRGLTEREAAAVLGVHQSTVHRRAETARTHLQEELS